MTKKKLAIFGGPPLINYNFKPFNTIGEEEINAVVKVMKTGVLSKFLGSWSEDFYGGPKVKQFESELANYFKVKHAITVNSWTSGLICAIGAIDVNPGDEIIVTPWTMCATATAILHWNAIPVFADIKMDTFNIDPHAVENLISNKTKAIIAADIFGQSCDINELKNICKKNKLKLITDSAQSPGSFINGKLTGTLSDIGGYSLNYHKHIHTGEGGIIITNDEQLAIRCKLIRNHAEAAIKGLGSKNLSNMIGHNFRLGEIEAAIGIEQLKKLDNIVQRRQQIAIQLTNELKKLPGLKTPYIPENKTHSYYIYPMILDLEVIDVKREKIIAALEAEGVKGLINGYVNVHLLPIFQNKIAYGNNGFPWNSTIYNKEINYKKGICPNAEYLHDNTFIGFEMCLYDLNDKDIKLIIKAFNKVWQSLELLKN